MCGIAGYFRPGGLDASRANGTLAAMTDVIQHRGPDDSGTWMDGSAGIALGHRRLAILDLSPTGHQPMRSASGRYVVAFNGSSRASWWGWGIASAVTPTRKSCSPPSASGACSGRSSGSTGCSRSPSGTGRIGCCTWRAIARGRSRSTTGGWAIPCCSARSSRHCAPIPNAAPQSIATRWPCFCGWGTCPARIPSTGACGSCRRARS